MKKASGRAAKNLLHRCLHENNEDDSWSAEKFWITFRLSVIIAENINERILRLKLLQIQELVFDPKNESAWRW